MKSLSAIFALAAIGRLCTATQLKMYGVNLGGLFLSEPWMNPKEWIKMGGENCTSCANCTGTEAQLVKKLGQTKANEVFAEHRKTWFAQSDVDKLKKYGINAVRIPIGFWIVEGVVAKNETWPQGLLPDLKRTVKMLKKAGILSVIDLHGLPGSQTPNQAFTGECTSVANFYNEYNFQRALNVTAAITALVHIDPDFSMTFSIQAANEPQQDMALNPGYTQCTLNSYFRLTQNYPVLQRFTNVIRTVEQQLGYKCNKPIKEWAATKLDSATIKTIDGVLSSLKLGKFANAKTKKAGYATCLTTTFQDAAWFYQPYQGSASVAVNGPALFDNHLYFYFGGVAKPTEDDYFTYLCNNPRYQSNAAYANPAANVFIGEWWLAAEWIATDDFYRRFADVQKRAYSKGVGWFFWNFKIEKGNDISSGDVRQGILRDYVQSVEHGYLTKDPSRYFYDDPCAKYVKRTKVETCDILPFEFSKIQVAALGDAQSF